MKYSWLAKSYRCAEEILRSRSTAISDLDLILSERMQQPEQLFKGTFRTAFRDQLHALEWESDYVVDSTSSTSLKLGFMKDRIGLELGTQHSQTMGTHLMRLQASSAAGHDAIDAAVYVMTTRPFQEHMRSNHGQNWGRGEVNFEWAVEYLPLFSTILTVPLLVMAVDIEQSSKPAQSSRLKLGTSHNMTFPSESD